MQKTLSAKILLRECLNWLLCYVQAEIADNTFSPIILGSADSGRQNCRAVMLCQLLVRFVENDLIPRICTGSTKKISGTHWESYLIQQYSDGVFRKNGALFIAVFEEKMEKNRSSGSLSLGLFFMCLIRASSLCAAIASSFSPYTL